MKVALVHDWLNGMRGGEVVLEAIAGMFPTAELYTLIHVPHNLSPTLALIPTHVSLLQHVPGAIERYRHFLPLMPAIIERMDLSSADLIISSSHCVAKGVRKRADAVHVSYVHAPMRYMWDRFDEYFGPGRASPTVQLAARAARPLLQRWDRRSSTPERIDRVVANSRYIAGRIGEAWHRHADVVYPFANLERFLPQPRRESGKYLMVTAFAPYKRVDLAIEAFERLGLPLEIVGSGQDEHSLRAMPRQHVEFLGARSNDEIAALYAGARGLVFPGVEDFGITPVEAMASGTPVIALAEGGALETVTDRTGVFFKEQTVDAIVAAVRERESRVIDEAACRERAGGFSRARFVAELGAIVRDAWTVAGKDAAALAGAMKA